MIHGAEDVVLTKAQRDLIEETKTQLDGVFKVLSEDLTGGKYFSSDKRSKEFLKRHLNRPVTFEDVKKFNEHLSNERHKQLFEYEGVYFIINYNEQITTVETYVTYLEKVIINNNELVEDAITQREYFTSLGFYDLIKLAFKRLFGRNK